MEELKRQAIRILSSMPNVSPNDVANIIETVRECYIDDDEHRRFLRGELTFFIDGIRNA
ncbi:MAG: hypothetical protein J6Y04_04420 [Bacteroidaceae bacterium]|nr:hypothetical protein [Bacteroidaceae bacterium]